ncbi:TPA: hypothetical protein REW71_005392 [Klebsiella pneumoniae]|nr:hypothetical protein [Klebsiella pneumoniae]
MEALKLTLQRSIKEISVNTHTRPPRRVFIALLFPQHQHVQCKLHSQIDLVFLSQHLNHLYQRVHFFEKLILIRHGAALFGVFLSITALFTKIN